MTNDIRLWIYPGANPNSVPTEWGPFETDISQYIRRPGNDGGAPIQYSWGKQDESTQTDAGQMTLTLDNRDGRFSTDKIDGPYYGLIDVNTPIRLGVTAATDTFTRTIAGATGPAAGWGTVNATLGQAWLNSSIGAGSCTYSVDGTTGLLNIPGANQATVALLGGGYSRDVDMVSSIIPKATATGAAYGMGHAVRYTNDQNFVYSTLEFNTAGNATIKIRRNLAGVVAELASSNPIPASTYSANVAWKLRTQTDGDTIRIKAWPAAGSEPSAWMLSADEGDNAGSGVGIYAARFSGNTNVGNILGLDNLVVTGLEWTGFVVSWPLRWDITGRNSWAPITAGGVLRRLRQGTNPVQSPLRRQLGATADVSGYWPMEEGSDAKYFLPVAPVTPVTAVASFSGVTPAGDNTLPGGGPAPTIDTAGGSIRARVSKAGAGTGMAAAVLFKLPSLPATKTRLFRVRTSRGPAPIYDFSVDATGMITEALAADGTVLSTATNFFGATADYTKWTAWQLETDNSGGNTAWSSIDHRVGEVLYYAQTGTVSGGTNTVVSSIECTGPVGTAFAHIWLGMNTFPFVTDSFSLVSSGYAGETAAARFRRACIEAGLAYSIAGPTSMIAFTEPMGPQREANTLAVLQSCIDADYGVLAERGAGVEMIPRNARWNLTQAMALSVAGGHIADIPQPTRDDQRLRNRWTISRVSGGSGSFQDDDSVSRNGTWEDSATLNVKDDSVLVNHAAWRTTIGVQHRLRWPLVSMNFARSPSLLNIWRQRFYGWRFGITTGLTQVAGNEPDLIMEGYQASLDPDIWTVEMNCTDARVWTAAVTDDTGIYGRVDADEGQITTTALISATALSIPITTAAGYPKWDNTAGLWSGGLDLNVGGERVTVTSITNGAGQAQTLNVSARGVGGYAAIHPSGAPVSLWYPAVVAL